MECFSDYKKLPPEPEPEKFVIHDPVQGIALPPVDSGIFAVVQVGGQQLKVDIF